MLQALNGSNEVSSKYCTNVTADITMKCTLNDLAEDTLYVVRVNASFEVYSAVEQVYVHTKEMKEIQQNSKGTYHMRTKRIGNNKLTKSKQAKGKTDRQPTNKVTDRQIYEYLIKGKIGSR